MIKEKIQKMKEILKIKEGEDNKKKIENLVVFIVILIITIIMINTIWNNGNKDNKKALTNTDKILAKTDTNEKVEDVNSENNELEEKLKNILKKIEGVGNVEVLITYSESSEILAMYNEDNTKNDTEEKDTRWSAIEK